MTAIHVVGMAAVAGGGWLLGGGLARALGQRERALAEIIGALSHLRARVALSGDALDDAMRAAADVASDSASSFLRNVASRMDDGNALKESVSGALHALPRTNTLWHLSTRDRVPILALAREMGAGGLAEQRAALEAALSALETQRVDAKDKQSRNARLYRALGAMGGIASALMLL